MMRYDPYTDSFIDNPTKETTATINLNAFPKNIIQMNVVEVSDASIEKIADAVVRKLADRKTEPTISKMEQVDKDINVRSKDEPQTDWKDQMWAEAVEQREHAILYEPTYNLDDGSM